MQTRYCYLHDSKHRRHIAIAREYEKQNSLVTFAMSISHPSDKFTKKLGREIATNRLRSNKGFTIHVPVGMTPIQSIMAFLAWSKDSRVPMCASKMADDWFEMDLQTTMQMKLTLNQFIEAIQEQRIELVHHPV